MNSEPTIEQRDPDPNVTVSNPVADVIYLMPSANGIDGRPAYMGADALLAKRAIADGVPIAYAVHKDRREFVEYFSAEIDVIGLYVAVVNLVPSIVQGIQSLIELSAMRKGYTAEEVKKAKVDVKIDYIKTPTTEARGIRVKGNADSVVEIMKSLSAGS